MGSESNQTDSPSKKEPEHETSTPRQQHVYDTSPPPMDPSGDWFGRFDREGKPRRRGW